MVLISAIAFGIGKHSERSFVGIGSVLHYCSSADKQLKVDKMGIFECVSIGAFSVEPKSKVPRSEIIQENIFFPTRLNLVASEVVGASTAHNVTVGMQAGVSPWWKVLIPTAFKSSTRFNFEFIGWCLSAILECQPGFDTPISEYAKSPFWDSQIGPQLTLRHFLLQRERFARRDDRVLSRFRSLARLAALPSDAEKGQQNQQSRDTIRPCNGFHDPEFRAFGVVCFGAAIVWLCLDSNRKRAVGCAILLALIAWVCIAGHTENCEQSQKQNQHRPISLQHGEIVPQKPIDIL